MRGTIEIFSRIAAGLLVLAAACGNGRSAEVKQLRTQASGGTELEGENGLSAGIISQSCLSIDSVTTGMDDGSVDQGSLDPDAPIGVGDLGPSIASCGDLMNGLPPNMLGSNGLHPNSFKNSQFQKWFAADPSSASLVMKYLVRCSLPAMDVLTYTDPQGVAWSWAGGFGLAPTWASGHAIPAVEQQLVSGCVAAHANKYGVHVPISVLANGPDGSPIPYSDSELSTFSVTEGCFFGNLFKKDGVFSGSDRPVPLSAAQSSLRACAMPGAANSPNCAPIQYAGSCRDVCQTDPTGLYYVSCTVNGKTYRPVTTRIQPNVQFACGDGVCQRSEKCGTGDTADNCGLDCGPCN